MIARLIDWSIHNRILVLLLSVILTGWGIYALKETPVDAIPDLSDVQVIIRTSYPGQAPQVVEDQVTYPLTTAMLSVPEAVNVRGYSFFGDSYRVRDLRGRHRSLLGAQPGARVPEPGGRQAAARGAPDARSGRHRRRLGVRVRPRRPQRPSRSRPAAQPAGLVPEVRAADRAGRGRGRHRRRHGASSTRSYVDPDKLRAYQLPLDAGAQRRSRAATRRSAAR